MNCLSTHRRNFNENRIAVLLNIGFLVASAAACHAQTVFQFDANQGVVMTATNVVWKSINRDHWPESPKLMGDAMDWQKNLDSVVTNVKGPTAEPMRFDGACSNKTVRSVMMVVKCAPDELNMRESLFCGERVFRLAPRPDNEITGNQFAKIERGGCCNIASWLVDTVEGADVEAGETHLIEVDFGQDVRLETLGVGGDTGRPEWQRAWRGGMLEIIGFSDVPNEDARIATRHYLNKKWRVGLEVPEPTTAQMDEARFEGVNMGFVYATLLIVR